MPRKIVDFSAISKIIEHEPFYLHFWESTPQEALEFLKNPRKELEKMGVKLPGDCRIETTIENHDWMSAHSGGFTKANGTIVCGTGGGNVAKNYYKVSFFGHTHAEIGKFKKELLHTAAEGERQQK
jgi:hypothetical protein